MIDDFPGVQHFIFSVDFDQPLSFDSPEDLDEILFSRWDFFLEISRFSEVSGGAGVDGQIDFRESVQLGAVASADIFFFSLQGHENASKIQLINQKCIF